MELKLEEITPYIPYGLKVDVMDYESDYVNKQYDTVLGVHNWSKTNTLWSVLTLGGAKPDISRVKPLLKPLSDWNKTIEDGNFRYGSFLHNEKQFNGCIWNVQNDYIRYNPTELLLTETSYKVLQKMFEWHFDVFGLIPKGLAIDVNTVED